MNEIAPCPKNPSLLCVPRICGNNKAVSAIQTALDEVTVPLIQKARKEGFDTEDGVAAYVERQEEYLRAAGEALEALRNLPLDQCAPLANLPSAS